MKTKHIFLLLIILSMNFPGKAQPFLPGDKVVNLGLGIGATWYSGSGYKVGFPPLSGTFEYGVTELGPGVLGIGGYLGFSSYKWEDIYTGTSYGWKYSSTIIGARGSYHYNFHENLDTYAGMLLGFNIISSKATGNWPSGYDFSANSSSFIWSIYVGGRWYFTDSVAAFLELGYGITWLNIGVAFKF
jgi:hypothetical protein